MESSHSFTLQNLGCNRKICKVGSVDEFEMYLERLRRADPSDAIGGVLARMTTAGYSYGGHATATAAEAMCKKNETKRDLIRLLDIGDNR
jgi:hypothetical protein